MANIMKKREQDRNSHGFNCRYNVQRRLRVPGDVIRCEHGVITMGTRALPGRGLQSKELDMFRNPILYRRAIRAIREEERANASPD